MRNEWLGIQANLLVNENDLCFILQRPRGRRPVPDTGNVPFARGQG